MSARYFIQNGQTISPVMPMDWDGCLVSFLFYGPTGLPVSVTGLPVVSRSLYEVGDIFNLVQPFATGEWRFNGPAARVKVSLAGVTGFTTYKVLIWRTGDPLPMVPDGAFTGLRAMVSQSYNEANVKMGRQSYIRTAWPLADPIAAGTPRKIHFRTGALQVIFKGRVFDYVSEEMTLTLYEGATGITGGTAVPVRNFNRVSPVASLVTVTKNVTATSNGTVIDDAEYFFGSANAPQRNPGSIPTGRERILKPNTSYLIEIAGAGRAQYFGDWYEGAADLPIAPQ